MSLQSAPLGQLPNMSMPYSIPRYEKGPSIWEKALGALLVNAAGGVAAKATDNLMSRDYATAADGGPATGFSRLLGPKVDARLNEQRQGQAYQSGEADKSRLFQGEQSDLGRMEQEYLAGKAQDATAYNQGNAQDASLYERKLADIDAQQRLENQLAGEQENLRLKSSLEGRDPESVARTDLLRSQGKHYDSQTAFQNNLLQMLSGSAKGKTGPASGVQMTDADRAAMDAVRQGIGAPATTEGNYTPGARAGVELRNLMQQLRGDNDGTSTVLKQSVPMSIEPNTLRRVPTASLETSPEIPSTIESGVRTNDAVADWMRSLAYGTTNLVRPSNWSGDLNSAVYAPERGSLPSQLQSRYNALTDKTSPTAQHLQMLMRLLTQPSS